MVGLARSGEAAARALARRGIAVRGYDRDERLELGRLREAGVEVILGAEDPALLEDVDLVVKSPGVPAEATLLGAARERGVPVWSEVELGSRLVRNPMIGVTGTNGKTTTTELVGAMFSRAGWPGAVAGNVGRPLTALDEAKLPEDAWVVCELSSFQLEDIETLRPRVGVLLNLEADHLDRHGTVAAYREAKLRLFENQGAEDVAVVPRGFGEIPGSARRVEFDRDDPLPAEPILRGSHNRENAVAATAVARAVGLPDEAVAEALRTFPGVAHRLELVREIHGVAFVNDSKATNVAAARRALATFSAGPVHVILGGSLKGESFDPLADSIGGNVRRAYLIGEAADAIAAALERAGVSYERSGDLETAVRAAARAARAGNVVLLSPACASFDQFRDYEDRGETFRSLVETL